MPNLFTRLQALFKPAPTPAEPPAPSRDEIAAEIFRPAPPPVPVDEAQALMSRQPRPSPTAVPTTETAEQRRWRNAMPVCLLPFATSLFHNVDTADYTAMRLAMQEEYSTPSQQALDLLAWYGQGVGDWRRYPRYETAAEQFLMELPLAAMVEALEDNPLDEAHLEGAARFFSGDLFQGLRGQETAAIPAAIRRALAEHCQADTAKASAAAVFVIDR